MRIIWNDELYHMDRKAYARWYYLNYTKKGARIGKKSSKEKTNKLKEGKDFVVTPLGDVYGIKTKEFVSPRDIVPGWYRKRERYNANGNPRITRKKHTNGSDYDSRYYNFDKENAWRRNKRAYGSTKHYTTKNGEVKRLPFYKKVIDNEGNSITRGFSRGRDVSVMLNYPNRKFVESMKKSKLFPKSSIEKVVSRKMEKMPRNSTFMLKPMARHKKTPDNNFSIDLKKKYKSISKKTIQKGRHIIKRLKNIK